MKKIRLTKLNAIIIGLTTLTLASCICLTCFAFKDNKGKDGLNGKDADISINDDGEILVNDSQTGIYANKADCIVKLGVDGNQYGKVVGGGRFSLKETIAVQAIPNQDACFKGWKDDKGNIVSLDKIYTFPAIKGEVNLTALFEKSDIEVYFKVPKSYEYYFNDNLVVKLNGQVQELVEGSNETYYFKNPAIFGYGDEITIKLDNFVPPENSYSCYLLELDEDSYFNNGKNKTRIDLDDSLEYKFTTNENRAYYFRFDMEISIIIGLVPTIEVTSSNDEYGSASSTSVSSMGEEATLTATAKDSGTTDYIYAFKGWYLDDELISTNPIYRFNANQYRYYFKALFIKKYALKIDISILNRNASGVGVDPNSYVVTYKSIKVNSFDTKGNTYSVGFNGNHNGATPELSSKICGYFEVGEKIFLSNEIESSHDSYYKTNTDGEKEYKEKFVYSRWKYSKGDDKQVFSTGSSAVFMLNENMDLANTKINIELFVVHYNDRVGE